MINSPTARAMDAQIQARFDWKILILGSESTEREEFGAGLSTSPLFRPKVSLSAVVGDLRSESCAGSGDPRTTRARRMTSSLKSRPKDSVGRACTDCETDRSS